MTAMNNNLALIESRVSRLGNHFQKYLIIIKQHYEQLSRALSNRGYQTRINLWHPSRQPDYDMGIISSLADDEKTRVNFLGCYYGIQFLQMNCRYLDILDYQISLSNNPGSVYQKFMMDIGAEFRTLSVAFLKNLLNIYLPDESLSRFFICSVGTRSDQDDIDVGIITRDAADNELLDNAFRKITQHMLVYATPLHLYLSEEVGHQHYTTSIAEYQELLDRRIQNVVIISELLNARLMLGNKQLFDEFIDRITRRYYYKPDNTVRYHEGFLRGIMGEARAILITPPNAEVIAPKPDALRLLKSMLYAKKTIFGVPQVNAWDIMHALSETEPSAAFTYESLSEILSFVEIFKFLLQLYVVQEETFQLKELEVETIEQIATHMGYSTYAIATARDQLLIDYNQHVHMLRTLANQIISDINPHLEKISGINSQLAKLQRLNHLAPRSNVVFRQFIKEAEFYIGVKYWDDVLDMLERNDAALKNILRQITGMSSVMQQRLLNVIAKMSAYSQFTVIRLLGIIGKMQDEVYGKTIFLRLNEIYLNFIISQPASLDRLCRLYTRYSKDFHQYLQFVPPAQLILIKNWFEQSLRSDELTQYLEMLKTLLNLHLCSSKYFFRYIHSNFYNHPECLQNLNNMDNLKRISHGLLAVAPGCASFQESKKNLGDYYDLEFMRIGINSMKGVSLQQTNEEFTRLSDTYLTQLFMISLQEVQTEFICNHLFLDGFALYTTGGHGRGQAYDDDYDLIALIDEENAETVVFMTCIISHMNREIARRGLLPHYRLGEILGKFVCPISEIQTYFNKDNAESFIDFSQLLGARLVIGSDEIKNRVREKIILPFLSSRKQEYIRKMINEIMDRKSNKDASGIECCNIKEIKGGLRDIEAVSLIIHAFLALDDHLAFNDFQCYIEKLPALAAEFEQLSKANNNLRHIRNIYRLTVTADDTIQHEYLEEFFRNCTWCNKSKSPEIEDIYSKFRAQLTNSEKACRSIILHIESLLENN